MKLFTAFVALVLSACASSPQASSLYFPQLAARARVLEPAALVEALALASTTPPGERQEELAEIVALYVRAAPSAFLKAQESAPSCFGVAFLGPRFVDNPAAQARELAARRQALEAVAAQSLAGAKARCLAELAGS